MWTSSPTSNYDAIRVLYQIHQNPGKLGSGFRWNWGNEGWEHVAPFLNGFYSFFFFSWKNANVSQVARMCTGVLHSCYSTYNASRHCSWTYSEISTHMEVNCTCTVHMRVSVCTWTHTVQVHCMSRNTTASWNSWVNPNWYSRFVLPFQQHTWMKIALSLLRKKQQPANIGRKLLTIKLIQADMDRNGPCDGQNRSLTEVTFLGRKTCQFSSLLHCVMWQNSYPSASRWKSDGKMPNDNAPAVSTALSSVSLQVYLFVVFAFSLVITSNCLKCICRQ